MLRELRRRKQQVADKIGHEEYIYRLNGDPFHGQEEIRVRPQGDFDPRRGAGNNNAAPPFAVDDDYGGGRNNANRRGNGRPVAPLNPITGAPAAPAAAALGGNPNGNNGAALVPYRPSAAAAVGYSSPYGNLNNNNGGGGGYALAAPQQQPVVTAFAPVMPPMMPVGELPGPLPPVYHPKPPITFRSNGGGAPLAPAPLYYPGGGGGGGAGNWPPAPIPNYGPYSNNNGDDGNARPNTSPAVLPPISLSQGGGYGEGNINNGTGGGGARSPRPSTSGAAAAGFIVGSSGLSDAEERYKEKMAARQRAIELQQENARQMLEQQRRRQAEREREIKEDREAENRLRREREEVARREQAELDRERQERELKLMGPRAAQEMLEQQRKETEARREAEAAERRNRGRRSSHLPAKNGDEEGGGATAAAAAQGQQKEPDAASNNSPQSDNGAEGSNGNNNNSNGGAAPPLPYEQRSPINFSSALLSAPPPVAAAAATALPTRPGMYQAQQYFANIGLGGAGITPPPNTPTPAYYAPLMMQRQQRIQLEGDVIHEELRHIALLLEAQQLSNAIAQNTPPPPWLTGPLPSSAAGAGTYLTTGLPSPLYDNPYRSGGGRGGGVGGQQGSSPLPPTSVPSAGAPYRTFTAGGSLPAPPLATALPSSSSSMRPQPFSSSASPVTGGGGAGAGLWQNLFSPSLPGYNGGGRGNPNYGGGGGGGFSGDGADSEELAVEPSQFVMPASAPPSAFIPAPTTTATAAAAATTTTTAGPASACQRGRSNSSSLVDTAPHTQAGPVERPGTGKPENASRAPLPSAETNAVAHVSPPADSAAPAATDSPARKKRGYPSAPPSTTHRSSPAPSTCANAGAGADAAAAEEGASAELQLASGLMSASVGDSPVRGTTPHLTATEVVDAEKQRKRGEAAHASLSSLLSPLAPFARKPRAGTVEPPVVVLTPRSKGDDEGKAKVTEEL